MGKVQLITDIYYILELRTSTNKNISHVVYNQLPLTQTRAETEIEHGLPICKLDSWK